MDTHQCPTGRAHAAGIRLDTSLALRAPSAEALKCLIDDHLSSGLWKIGSCYQDQLDARPRSAQQYNPKYFDRDGAVCLVYGLTDKASAAELETAAIHHTKFVRRTGVNTKSRDDVPHAGYSPSRAGALYGVPVWPYITTQQQFKDVHVSYYKERQGPPDARSKAKAISKARSKAAKRAELLNAMIAKIGMQQLRRGFSGRDKLSRLVVKHGFKTVRTTIFNELKELFEEL